MLKKALIALVILGLTACNFIADKASSPEANELVDQIEKKHQKESWYAQELIVFDLELYFSGKARFIGTVSMTPDGGKVKMESADKTMIWDGENAWTNNSDADATKVRFDLLTWSYFFAAPYKFSDPGTKYSEFKERKLDKNSYPSFKLSFENGVGDSPDDWYIVYKDSKENLLAAMAYIVTYSKDVKDAEQDPHLITYEAYETVNGIPIATQWNFWTWNEAGEMKKLLGNATISKVHFTKKAESVFQPSASFKILGKPQA